MVRWDTPSDKIMGGEEEMKLSDIYSTILASVNTITEQTYVIDRAPQVNFSDGYSGTYRYIRPSRITKERRSQGAPETVVEVEVGILAIKPSQDDITAAEDELDSLLNSLLRTGQIAPNIIVYAASTAPTNTQYLAEEGLDAEVPVLACTATIAIRGYY